MRALCFASALLITSAALGGPLVPSAGPVAPTMKPLNEVEPRTAINSTNTPGDANSLYRITQPGSYYLTGNVLGESGKPGIEVAAHNVTIDLGGFDLRGVAGSLDGVNTKLNRTGLAIHNGAVTGWGGDGIRRAFATCVSVRGLRVSGNTGNGEDGIWAQANCTVNGCTSTNNMGSGIRSNSENIITGNTCTGNGYSANDGAGIHIVEPDNRVEGNTVSGNDRGVDCDVAGNFIVRNSASGNTVNFSISGTQTIGPIITATGTITTSNPWANFEY